MTNRRLSAVNIVVLGLLGWAPGCDVPHDLAGGVGDAGADRTCHGDDDDQAKPHLDVCGCDCKFEDVGAALAWLETRKGTKRYPPGTEVVIDVHEGTYPPFEVTRPHTTIAGQGSAEYQDGYLANIAGGPVIQSSVAQGWNGDWMDDNLGASVLVSADDVTISGLTIAPSEQYTSNGNFSAGFAVTGTATHDVAGTTLRGNLIEGGYHTCFRLDAQEGTVVEGNACPSLGAAEGGATGRIGLWSSGANRSTFGAPVEVRDNDFEGKKWAGIWFAAAPWVPGTCPSDDPASFDCDWTTGANAAVVTGNRVRNTVIGVQGIGFASAGNSNLRSNVSLSMYVADNTLEGVMPISVAKSCHAATGALDAAVTIGDGNTLIDPDTSPVPLRFVSFCAGNLPRADMTLTVSDQGGLFCDEATEACGDDQVPLHLDAVECPADGESSLFITDRPGGAPDLGVSCEIID